MNEAVLVFKVTYRIYFDLLIHVHVALREECRVTELEACVRK